MGSAEGPRSRWLFVLFAALIGVALLVLFLLQGRYGAERARGDAERLAQALASGLSEQISRTIETAQVLLVDVRNRRADGVAPLVSPSMAALAREMPQLRALAVADAGGVVRAANVPGMIGRDIGDREWFRSLRDFSGTQMQLMPPEPGRLLEPVPRDPWPARWTIPLVLPLRSETGGFEGAAIALLNAEYLTATAQRQAEAFHAIIRLYDFKGIMLARGDLDLQGIGQRHPGAWLFRDFLPRRESGTFTGPDGFGHSVSAGFALTRLVPIVIEVAQPSEVVLASVQEQNMIFLGAIAALATLALTAVLVLIRQGDRLAASEAEARAAGEAKEEFLASMSHEIRTPVSGVIGLSDLLLEERLSPAQRRYAETIHASAQHLLTLLNDILDFSKLEAGAATPEAMPFSIEEQLTTIVELFAPRAAAKGVELVCLPAPGLPQRVVGDPARFRQVLFNLVGNAVKFTERGWIRLSVSAVLRPDGQSCDIACAVSDTGIGIDPARIPSLFDRFSQADASIRRRYGGTGLGLAISLRLAELLGGTIEAQPRAGGGSVFRFLLTMPVLSPPRALADAPLAGKRALVIECGEQQRQVLVLLLQSLGVETQEVLGLAEAEALLARLPGAFDAIVLGTCTDMPDVILAGERLRRCTGEDTRRILFGSRGGEEGPLPYGLFHAILLKPALPGRVREAFVHALNGRSDAPDPPASPVREPVTPGAERPRLLLAEDNPVNQFMLRKILEKAGAQVDIVADGLAAVQAAEAHRFDAIVMDLQMPELDGIGATVAIRNGAGPNASTPIIGLTANVGTEHERNCREAGMTNYLTKPVDRVALLTALGLKPALVTDRDPAP